MSQFTPSANTYLLTCIVDQANLVAVDEVKTHRKTRAVFAIMEM